MKLAPFKRTGL